MKPLLLVLGFSITLPGLEYFSREGEKEEEELERDDEEEEEFFCFVFESSTM
jgi:helix-turn-helix protein